MLRPDQFTTISRARDDRASVRRRISELSGLKKARQSSIISQSFFTCPPRVSLLFQPLNNSLAASNDLQRWKNNFTASLSQRFVRDTKIHGKQNSPNLRYTHIRSTYPTPDVSIRLTSLSMKDRISIYRFTLIS